MMIKC